MMKKYFLMAAFAVMTMCVNAQDLVTYDGAKFAVPHPADYADVVDPWDDAVNEWKKDDQHRLTVWYYDDASDVANMKTYGELMKMQKETNLDDEPTGWQVEVPVVKGNIMTIRSVKDDVVCILYLVNIQDTECFKGEFTFLQSEEAQYKPILDSILTGLKKK